jgi:hypothetical protein
VKPQKYNFSLELITLFLSRRILLIERVSVPLIGVILVIAIDWKFVQAFAKKRPLSELPPR